MSSKKEKDDAELLEAFRKQFNLDVGVEVMKRLLGSSSVRPWYLEYKQKRGLRKALPPQWAEVGVTPEEWTAGAKAREELREERARVQSALTRAKLEYAARMEAVKLEHEAWLRQHYTPMLALFDSGVHRLPLKQRVGRPATEGVELAPGDASGKASLLHMRKEALQQIREGKDPFDGLLAADYITPRLYSTSSKSEGSDGAGPESTGDALAAASEAESASPDP